MQLSFTKAKALKEIVSIEIDTNNMDLNDLKEVQRILKQHLSSIEHEIIGRQIAVKKHLSKK